MIQEGSKTPLIIGIVLAALCALACLIGGAFLFFGVRVAAAPAMPVTVAAAAPAPAPVTASFTIAVQPDGGVWVGDQQVLPADLEEHLADRFRASGDAQVVIAADRSLSHQQVIDVVDRVKRAGYTKLALAVGQP